MTFVDPQVLMRDIARRAQGAAPDGLAGFCARAALLADMLIADWRDGVAPERGLAARLRRVVDALFAGVHGPVIGLRPVILEALVARIRAEAAMTGAPLPALIGVWR